MWIYGRFPRFGHCNRAENLGVGFGSFIVVCDNASNMTKAFKVSLWEDDDDSAVEEEEYVGEELFENDDHPMNGDLVQDIANLDLQSLFQENYRQPCTIRTLQLNVKDCIKLLPS